MNQSISEEWEKLFDGHCICDMYGVQGEDIGCIIHGIDGIKAKKFIQSKISQDREETAQDFADWLHKKGYIDSDYYTEEPKAVEAFLSSYKK